MRIRINDFLARNEPPVIIWSHAMMASAGPHGRPATGPSNARADRRRAVKGQKIVT
jgi:hypothetical protein